jgi:colicin import membrane protein
MKIRKMSACLAVSLCLHTFTLAALIAANHVQSRAISVEGQLMKVQLSPSPNKETSKEPDQEIVQAVMIDQARIQKHVAQIKKQKALKKRQEQRQKQKLEQELKKIRKAAQLERQKLNQIHKEQHRKKRDLQLTEKEILLAQQKKKYLRSQVDQTHQKLRVIEAERMKILQQEKSREIELEHQVALEHKIRSDLAMEKKKEARENQKQIHAEISKYRAMIQSTIQRSLILQDTMRDQECVVQLRLAEDGFVTSIRRVSGSQVLCRQAEAAIYKSKRLPVSSDPRVYQEMKNINLTIKPELN